MNALSLALVGGVVVLLAGLFVKPLEGLLRHFRRARHRAWWKQRRADEAVAFDRQRARRAEGERKGR